jgi:SAM-dependent methyltransferase
MWASVRSTTHGRGGTWKPDTSSARLTIYTPAPGGPRGDPSRRAAGHEVLLGSGRGRGILGDMTVPFDYDGRPERYRLGMRVAGEYSAPSLYEWVGRLLDVPDVQVVLDVGCADGVLRRTLPPSGPRLIGLDLSATLLSAHPPPVVRADATHLHFTNGVFDAVTAVNVLYHLPDPVLAVRQARRVLRPGGQLLAATISRHDSPEIAAYWRRPTTTFDAEDAPELLLTLSYFLLGPEDVARRGSGAARLVPLSCARIERGTPTVSRRPAEAQARRSDASASTPGAGRAAPHRESRPRSPRSPPRTGRRPRAGGEFSSACAGAPRAGHEAAPRAPLQRSPLGPGGGRDGVGHLRDGFGPDAAHPAMRVDKLVPCDAVDESQDGPALRPVAGQRGEDGQAHLLGDVVGRKDRAVRGPESSPTVADHQRTDRREQPDDCCSVAGHRRPHQLVRDLGGLVRAARPGPG